MKVSYEELGYVNPLINKRTSISLTTPRMIDSDYYKLTSQGQQLFGDIPKNKIYLIKNKSLKQKVLLFIHEFMKILGSLQKSSNALSSFCMGDEDENSVLLEWIYKDFRFGFTFCEEESENMWYLVCDGGRDNLSVMGDLQKSDYPEVILKTLNFVMENT